MVTPHNAISAGNAGAATAVPATHDGAPAVL